MDTTQMGRRLQLVFMSLRGLDKAFLCVSDSYFSAASISRKRLSLGWKII